MENRENLKNKLSEHMITIFVPEFIQYELWEYLPYYCTSKIENMLKWIYDDFIFWYDENNNPYNY